MKKADRDTLNASELTVRKQLRRVTARFLAWLAGMTLTDVSNMSALGMPRNDDGTYDWDAVRTWVKREGRTALKRLPGGAKAADVPSVNGEHAPGTEGYESMDHKYKALARKQKFEREAGILIHRSDADREHLKLALAVRASLMALPDQIAAQLAELPAREVAGVLRERMRFICDQFREGWVPIAPEVGRAIDEAVALHVLPVPAEPEPAKDGAA